MMFAKGQRVEACVLGDNGKPTKTWLPVVINEVRRDHMSQQVISARVTCIGPSKTHHFWVQVQYMREPVAMGEGNKA